MALFFSRRIGLGPSGEEIPIEGGAAGVGQGGSKQHRDCWPCAPTRRLGIAPRERLLGRALQPRPSQPLVDRRDLRQPRRQGRPGPAGASTTATGLSDVDGPLGDRRVQRADSASWRAPTRPESNATSHAFQLLGRYNSESWSASLGFTEVGEGFNPEVGIPEPARLPQARGAPCSTAFGPKKLWGLHETPSAHLLPRFLGLQRFPGDRLSAPGQPLGVEERLRGAHRRQPHGTKGSRSRSRSPTA